MTTSYKIYENKMIRLILISFLISVTIISSNLFQMNSVEAQIGKFGSFTGHNFKYIKDSELFQLNQFSIAVWFKTNSTDPHVSF